MGAEDRADVESPVNDRIETPRTFEAAFEAHFPSIHRFLARRVGSALADDLAAETFVVAFRRRDSFDPSLGEMRPWLFGIATHLLRTHWREEQHLLALEARIAGEPSSPPADSDDEAVARWVAPYLARALGLLSQDQRNVLLLNAWADLSSEEIAFALGVPAGTVRSRLSRSRAELRDYLGSFDFDSWVFDEKKAPAQEDTDQ
jgi:RNA polymerase sigma factor (sigma-70 family)